MLFLCWECGLNKMCKSIGYVPTCVSYIYRSHPVRLVTVSPGNRSRFFFSVERCPSSYSIFLPLFLYLYICLTSIPLYILQHFFSTLTDLEIYRGSHCVRVEWILKSLQTFLFWHPKSSKSAAERSWEFSTPSSSKAQIFEIFEFRDRFWEKIRKIQYIEREKKEGKSYNRLKK